MQTKSQTLTDRLVFGKSELNRIVGIEPNGENAEVFIENPDGSIESQFVKNRYWVLSSRPLAPGAARLKGDLHYKYGAQFTELQKLYLFKNKHKDEVFSIADPKESLMVKDGYTYFKGMRHNEVSILSFDIETTGLTHDANSKVLIISNTLRKNGQVTRKLFGYSDYSSQGEMIQDWVNWVQEVNPSLITGHNIMCFDFPYMDFVANSNGVDLALGRDGSVLKFNNYESKFRVDGTRDLHYKKVKCYGRELIDTMFLAYKYDIGRKYESYGLKPIIKQEGLEVKDRVFYDAGKIKDNYMIPEEWEKIKAYAMFDADDALALFDLFVPPFFYMTQSIPKSFQTVVESASGSQINSIMMRSYLQEGHSLPKASQEEEYEGAISFGNPGIYRNVFKIDVASLYPSIMIQYEVCDRLKDPNGNFLNLVKTFTNLRLDYKKKAKEDKYYDDLQSAYKIFINSCYGFLGTAGLLFNSPKNAGFVTKTGREVLQKSISWAESNNFTIVNADTDSISFTTPNSEYISEERRKEILAEVNSLYPERIRFEDDGFYRSVIVLRAKNYILDDGKKVKSKGSAVKATTKEPALKEFIQEIIKAILENRDNYTEIYNKYVTEIMNVQDMKRWSSRKTITEKTMNSERANETKIMDAIEDSSYVEGDRVYVYFKADGTLGLLENFQQDHDKVKLLKKLFDTSKVFENVLDVKNLFLNYSLKRNLPKLEEFNAN